MNCKYYPIVRKNDMTDLFDFDDFFKPFVMDRKTAPFIRTDISEKDKSYLLEMDMPGFSKDEITLGFDNGYLTVTAAKQEKIDEKEKGRYIRRERVYGSTSRSFYIGDVDESSIEAEFKDGTLVIEIPKEEPKKIENKTIAIK
ncbi:MAG: Hsp20/alpha crystallin family protein [Clostridia bacterium]|nr:Hsp20/alpha crystallin family protein [Clostridia bacterium]